MDMNVISQVKTATSQILQEHFGHDLPAGDITINEP